MAGAVPRSNTGFQAIFAVFVGLMLTACIGVGLYTFYPPPQEKLNERIRDVNREQQALRNSKAPNELTDQDRARLQQLTDEINRTTDEARVVAAPWGRNTSIVLILFATLVMGVSLLTAERLPVLNNGLLLGGAFTMLYGVGLILATTVSIERFFVLIAALIITLGLGYVRFVTRRAMPAEASAMPAVADLETRVAALERRIDDAAGALGRKS